MTTIKWDDDDLRVMCWIGTTHASPICSPPFDDDASVVLLIACLLRIKNIIISCPLFVRKRSTSQPYFNCWTIFFFLFPSFISHRLFDYPQVRRARTSLFAFLYRHLHLLLQSSHEASLEPVLDASVFSFHCTLILLVPFPAVVISANLYSRSCLLNLYQTSHCT